MPRIKSSIKDVRKNRKQRVINKTNMASLRTVLKKARLSSGDERPAQVKKAVMAIDKAVQNGWIHKNAAARYKSHLTRTKKAAAVAAA
jgi:small subunit ribosomal protein S20